MTEMLRHYLNPNNDPRIYIAREVTFDYGRPGQCRVDYMQFKPLNNSVSGIEKGDVYCYEIKSCPEDFASVHGHNLLGDFNYYVMPKDTYDIVNNPRLKTQACVKHFYAGPSTKTCVIEQRRDTPLTPGRFTNSGLWVQACQA